MCLIVMKKKNYTNIKNLNGPKIGFIFFMHRKFHMLLVTSYINVSFVNISQCVN